MPQSLNVSPGGLSGDPLGQAGMAGDLAVGGHGVFHGHIGSLVGDVVEEYRVQGIALVPHEIFFHVYPGLPQQGCSLAVDQGVGVPGADDHLGNACIHNGLSAGGLTALVAAGFQGDIQGGSCRVLCAGSQSLPLGVEAAAAAVPALANDAALLHQHRPYQGIWAGPSGTPLGQLYSLPHIVGVVHIRLSLLFGTKKAPRSNFGALRKHLRGGMKRI